MMTAFSDRFQRPASKDDTFSATSGNFSLFRMASAAANKARDRVMVSFAPAIISTKSAAHAQSFAAHDGDAFAIDRVKQRFGRGAVLLWPSGGSTTGLSATGAWDKADAGDGH
jgi:hypothetical protein